MAQPSWKEIRTLLREARKAKQRQKKIHSWLFKQNPPDLTRPPSKLCCYARDDMRRTVPRRELPRLVAEANAIEDGLPMWKDAELPDRQPGWDEVAPDLLPALHFHDVETSWDGVQYRFDCDPANRDVPGPHAGAHGIDERISVLGLTIDNLGLFHALVTSLYSCGVHVVEDLLNLRPEALFEYCSTGYRHKPEKRDASARMKVDLIYQKLQLLGLCRRNTMTSDYWAEQFREHALRPRRVEVFAELIKGTRRFIDLIGDDQDEDWDREHASRNREKVCNERKELLEVGRAVDAAPDRVDEGIPRSDGHPESHRSD